MKNIKDYIGTKTAIHCSTEEEFNAIKKRLIDVDYCNIDKPMSYNFDDSNWEYILLDDKNTVGKGGFDLREDYITIESSEFLPEIKGELTKEEAKVSTEEYEFGEKVGSVQWVFKLFKPDFYVTHDSLGGVDCYIYHDVLGHNDENGYFEKIVLKQEFLTGWYRKIKDPKEELKEKIMEEAYVLDGYATHTCNFNDKLKELLEKYNITKKEKKCLNDSCKNYSQHNKEVGRSECHTCINDLK